MLRKLILMLCLLSFIVQPVLCETCSSRYIRLHSTLSTKTKKRLKSLELMPIEVTLNEKCLNIIWRERLGDICIIITKLDGGNIVYRKVVETGPSSIFVDLCMCNNGNYSIEFILSNETIVGDFVIE